MQKIMDNFGPQVSKFTMVLFTRREKVSRKEWTLILDSEETQKILNCFERKFHVINSKDECDPYQITHLLKSIDEMVKNNRGKYYRNENELEKVEMKQDVKKRLEKEHLEKQRSNINPEGVVQDKDKKDNEEEQEEYRVRPDLRIVLMGKTGSGKSASGNTILGLGDFQFKTKMSSKSITRSCERHVAEVEGKIVSIIDTPGICDTSMSEEDLKKEMERCVYMSVPGPHVFLLVIRLGRLTEEEKNSVKWIQENFGGEADRYTIILFTHSDQLKGEPLDEYISENNDLKALVSQCGGRFHSFNNEDKINRSQVTELMEKMVKENGGQHYTNEMYKKAQKKIESEAFKQRLRDIRKKALTGAVAVVGTVAVVAIAIAK